MACDGFEPIGIKILSHEHDISFALDKLTDWIPIFLYHFELRHRYVFENRELAREQKTLHDEFHAAGVLFDDARAVPHHHVIGVQHAFDFS